jgi:hypothetical protein
LYKLSGYGKSIGKTCWLSSEMYRESVYCEIYGCSSADYWRLNIVAYSNSMCTCLCACGYVWVSGCMRACVECLCVCCLLEPAKPIPALLNHSPLITSSSSVLDLETLEVSWNKELSATRINAYISCR